MKKYLSVIAMMCLSCAMLAGCVEDSQIVLLKGLVSGDSCNATGDNKNLSGVVTPNFDCDQWQCVDITSMPVYVNVVNNNATDSIWSASGGSSSGASLKNEIPNYNMIYVDKLTIKCSDVDGESSGCDGIDDVKYKLNAPVQAGGGMCHQILVDFSPFVALLGKNVNVSVTAHYHDTGNIKGETNKVIIPVIHNECFPEVDSLSCELKDDGAPCVVADQCKGGLCEADDANRMVCKSPAKDEENQEEH